MSVPYVAVKMKRFGIGIELNSQYWEYGVKFCERLEDGLKTPTLFDLADETGEIEIDAELDGMKEVRKCEHGEEVGPLDDYETNGEAVKSSYCEKCNPRIVKLEDGTFTNAVEFQHLSNEERRNVRGHVSSDCDLSEV